MSFGCLIVDEVGLVKAAKYGFPPSCLSLICVEAIGILEGLNFASSTELERT